MVSFHQYAWIASRLLVCFCALLLFYKKTQKQSPVFVSYVAAQSILLLLSDIANLILIRHFMLTEFMQWIAVAGTGILAVLEIAVLYELADDLVLSRTSLTSTVRSLMRWSAAILLLVAAGTAALLSRPGLARAMAGFQTLDLSSNFIEIGLLVVLLAFTRALQISWRSVPAGIALGLAVTGCTEIAGSALVSVATRLQYTEIDSLRLTGFCACIVIWVIYVLLPDEQTRRYSGDLLKLEEIKNWDEHMQKIRR